MSQHKLVSKETIIPFVLVTALFYLWALPNNLNDILIPQFMKSFELNRLQAGLVQSAFYLGYFLLAMPAAMIMDKYNYKTGLIIGLLLFGTGCYLFWPAAVLGSYVFFLTALFVIATGLAFLETGSNSFISVLGDPATAAQRLNLSQAFNPLGAMSGVLVGTFFIFSGKELPPAQVEAMKLAATIGLHNIEIVWGNAEKIGGTKLREGLVDRVILSNTLFQVESKDRDNLVLELKRITKSGGKLLLVDWQSGSPLSPPSVVPAMTAEALFQKSGWVLEKNFDAGDHHYGLILKKP